MRNGNVSNLSTVALKYLVKRCKRDRLVERWRSVKAWTSHTVFRVQLPRRTILGFKHMIILSPSVKSVNCEVSSETFNLFHKFYCFFDNLTLTKTFLSLF